MKQVKCEIYSRTVGYFRPVAQWNKGKQEEFKQRKLFYPDKIKNQLVRID
ncbi:MAG: hypothetical protein GY853_16115, partial [PVC group bacterium]|nr:hypothetical protein [PVC group bacterium]MCP4651587.1 hypothetical protein [PVC group bacterium]